MKSMNDVAINNAILKTPTWDNSQLLQGVTAAFGNNNATISPSQHGLKLLKRKNYRSSYRRNGQPKIRLQN